MSWMIIVGTILQALMPILKEWIESLLNRSAAAMDRDGKAVPADAFADRGVSELIAECRKRLTFWQRLWGCGRALDRIERTLQRKAPELWLAARSAGTQPCPTLTAREIAELKEVV